VSVPVTLFGLVFGAVGIGVGYLTTGLPLLHLQSAQHWQPARCEVTFSQVASSGDTSRIDIRYHYTWGDRTYAGSQYDFTVGSDNFSSQGKADIVSRYPPGRMVECFVNPDAPAESVINREMKWRYLFGVAFGAPFALVPIALLWTAVHMRRKARRQQQAAAPSLSTSSSPQPSSSFMPAGGFGSAPAQATATSSGDIGPVVLSPVASPLGKLIAITIICLFWDGIVGVFTYFEFTKPAAGGWFLNLFLIPFQFIGLALVWGFISQVLGLMNPRPTLTLSSRSVAVGGSLTMQWKFRGAVSRLSALRITLQGYEEARYRRGTHSHTDKHTFYDMPVVETSDNGRIEMGMATVTIPANTMHSFTATNNKIIWLLKVKGDILRWPDVDQEFEITVRPR
jgi:hypothetical protein